MYNLFVKAHIVVSTGYLVLATLLLLRSWMRWKQSDGQYDNMDKKLSVSFLWLLYFQFITGVVMYFFLIPDASQPDLSLEEAMRRNEMRFWVVEHLSIMIFSLIIAQTGRIFIKKTEIHAKKHKHTLFYYGISYLMILFSTGLAFYHEM